MQSKRIRSSRFPLLHPLRLLARFRLKEYWISHMDSLVLVTRCAGYVSAKAQAHQMLTSLIEVSHTQPIQPLESEVKNDEDLRRTFSWDGGFLFGVSWAGEP